MFAPTGGASLLKFHPIVSPFEGFREIDAFGGGGFGAPRKKDCPDCTPSSSACATCHNLHYLSYEHKGLDFIAPVRAEIVTPFPSRLTAKGFAYSEKVPLHSLHLSGIGEFSQWKAKLLYVFSSHTPGVVYSKSNIVIGGAEDVASYHETKSHKRGMINHVHFELFEGGHRVDPSPYFEGRPVAELA